MTAAVRTTAEPTSPQHRMDQLFDPGTWTPLQPWTGAGAVAARGRIDGRTVLAFCTEPRVRGGAMEAAGCAVIARTIDTAAGLGAPVVGLWHSGGARLDQGVAALEAVGSVFTAMVRASGRVPQISVVLGPAAGGAAYGAALSDVVVMAQAGRMFVTGPDVIRQVTGERVDMATLGGPAAHGALSGVAHVTAPDQEAALAAARELVGLLTAPRRPDPPTVGPRPRLDHTLPASPRRAYDVRPLVDALLDGPGLELQPGWAPNVVTTLGRIGGGPVGVVANNPIRLGGCLTGAASDKAARFVRTCDAFGVPLVVVVDVPGYLPGVDEEHHGVLRRGAKLLHAMAGASTPRVTLLTRKAYGGAYLAMNARSMGATAVFAWPTAQVAVMGAGAAVDILHRRRLAAAADHERATLREHLLRDHEDDVGDLQRLVDTGVVDAVVSPSDTPAVLAAVLAAAPAGRGRHSNIPL